MDEFEKYLDGGRGRQSALSRELGLTPGAITQWRGVVPLNRVVDVERATGIPRHLLRPDVFPAQEAAR